MVETRGGRAWRGVGAWVGVVGGFVAAAAAWGQGARADSDHWYILQMQGKRAGHLHVAQRREGETVRTASELRLVIKRGRVELPVEIESEFVETAAGAPVSMRVSKSIAAEPTVEEYEFTKGDVRVTTRQGEVETRETRALPEGAWLTPAAAAEYVERRLAAGDREITVRTVDPAAGLRAARIKRKIVERTTAEALGREVPAVKWVTTVDAYPGLETVEYADEKGVMIRSETNIGGIRVTTVLADRDLALAAVEAPELLVSTLVRPDRAIEGARKLSRGVYVLSVEEGELGDVAETGSQRVERESERAVRVMVETGGVGPGAADGDAGAGEYLAASALVNKDDPEVAALARRAVEGAGKGEAARAEAMRAFVHGYVTRKDLDVGFGSASEVARTRSGDCSEHAVLLAAMLRAEGIGSRVASGLIYADAFAGEEGVFAYHMWTQALVETGGGKRWVDLDATLKGAFFDATHVAVVVSSLGGSEPTNAMVALAPLLGRLRIEVVEAGGGR